MVITDTLLSLQDSTSVKVNSQGHHIPTFEHQFNEVRNGQKLYRRANDRNIFSTHSQRTYDPLHCQRSLEPTDVDQRGNGLEDGATYGLVHRTYEAGAGAPVCEDISCVQTSTQLMPSHVWYSVSSHQTYSGSKSHCIHPPSAKVLNRRGAVEPGLCSDVSELVCETCKCNYSDESTSGYTNHRSKCRGCSIQAYRQMAASIDALTHSTKRYLMAGESMPTELDRSSYLRDVFGRRGSRNIDAALGSGPMTCFSARLNSTPSTAHGIHDDHDHDHDSCDGEYDGDLSSNMDNALHFSKLRPMYGGFASSVSLRYTHAQTKSNAKLNTYSLTRARKRTYAQ